MRGNIPNRNAKPKISNRRTGSQAQKVPRPDSRKPGDVPTRQPGVAQRTDAGHCKPRPGDWNYSWAKKRGY